MLVWVVVTVLAAPLAAHADRRLSGAGWEAQGSTAQKVRDEIRRDFPHARRRSSGRRLPPADRRSRRTRRRCNRLVAQLQRAPHARVGAEPAHASRRAPG